MLSLRRFIGIFFFFFFLNTNIYYKVNIEKKNYREVVNGYKPVNDEIDCSIEVGGNRKMSK